MKTQDLERIKGIGPQKIKYLANLGIRSIQDLLSHYPTRYEDRRAFLSFQEIEERNLAEERICSWGEVSQVEHQRVRAKMIRTKITLCQGGSYGYLILFNRFEQRRYKIGDALRFYGKVQRFGFGHLEFAQAEIEKEGENRLTGRIYPIYPLTRGICNEEMIQWIQEALQLTQQLSREFLPQSLLKSQRLCPGDMALEQIHGPKSPEKLQIARYRLIFEEFFVLQLHLLELKKYAKDGKAYALQPWDSTSLEKTLPFSLTDAQKRAIGEIIQDMSSQVPMQRLLQGDVGCGKTMAAFFAIAATVASGYQAAFMVPTELLARQHFESAQTFFAAMGKEVRLLTGSSTKKQKTEILKEMEEGTCHLVIGTHALIQEGVVFHNLALAITDEQHRFGVKQRNLLYTGYQRMPHILVMTATPIPRTLAMILQGDLDISIIDKLPPGRRPIETKAIPQKYQQEAFAVCQRELSLGRQVYVVCPLVKENEKLDLQAAESLYEELKNEIFPQYQVGLVHGKMKNQEKNQVMEQYVTGQLHILVSTTVIEVGINVPNATVMVVQDAQRFGLSQLHQLRGRVGRGGESSYCLLLYKGFTKTLQERMEIMTKTNDGFLISEKDLQLRGPGEVFGMRQHGLPDFQLADFTRHQRVLQEAQRMAEKVMNGSLEMTPTEKNQLHIMVSQKFQQRMENISLA